MLKTKKDVDKHVRDLLSKLKSDTERKNRGYNIARHYFNIKEYESARRYLSEYISLRPKSADGHRLLGEIYKGLGQLSKAVQSYKTSYDLELTQKDLILKICEIYSEIECDESTRLYWLEEGERHFPHDETLVQCKEKLYQRTRSKSKDDLEKLYLDEIRLSPQNEKLHLSLLRLYQEWSEEVPSKVEDAYRFARKAESSGQLVDSAEWYKVVASVVELYETWKKPDRDKELEEFSLIILDRLVHHSLSRCSASLFDLSEVQDTLKKLDARLSRARKVLSGPLLTHMVGQLYFHMACLLLIRKRSEVLTNTEVSTGVLLSHTLSPHNNGTDIDAGCQTYRKTLSGAAAFRFSRAGHVLLRLARDNGGHHAFLEKVRDEMGKKECLKGLYTMALGPMPKAVSPSFFLTVPDFACIELRYPESHRLLLWDQEVCLNYSRDLKEVLWAFLQNSGFPSSPGGTTKGDLAPLLSLRFFKDLSYARDMRDVAPETLCHLDLVAFVLGIAFCIEEETGKLDRPSLLSGRLHTQEQEEFWTTVHSLVSNSAHKRMNHLRSVLRSGLESIRLLGPTQVPLPLATHLARAFTSFITCAKKDGHPDSQVRSLTERAEHYWKRTLSLCDRAGSYSFQLGSQSKSPLFSLSRSRASSFDLEEIREEGNYFLSERYVAMGRKEEAIQILSQLKTPQASLKLAMLYKECAFDQLGQKGLAGPRQEDLLGHLYKARDTLYLTLDRIRMPGVKATQAMNQELSDALSQVESALADASTTDGGQAEDDICCGLTNVSFAPQVADLTNGHVSGLTGGRVAPRHSSTPYKESTPTRTPRRQEARPSPERLDAQVRHLTDIQDNTIKTMQDHISALRTQNETLLDTCQTMVAEFKENVAFYKSILEQKKSQAEYFGPVNTQLQHLQDMIKDLQIEVRSLSGEVADLRSLRLAEKDDPKQDSSLMTETTSQVPLEMSNSAMQGIYNNYHSYYGGHQHVPNALLPPSALFNTCQPPFIPPSSLQSQPYMSSPGVVKPEATLASSPLYPSSPYQFSASMAVASSGLSFSSSSMKTPQSRTPSGAAGPPSAASAPHAFQITMPPQATLSFSTSMAPGPADSPKPAITTEGLLSNVPAPLYSAVVSQPSPPKASEKNVLVSSLKTTATAAVEPAHSPMPESTPVAGDAAPKEASPAPASLSGGLPSSTKMAAVTAPKEEAPAKDAKPPVAAPTTTPAILSTTNTSSGKFNFSGFTFSSTPSISAPKSEAPPKEAPQPEPKKESMFANLTFRGIGTGPAADGTSSASGLGLSFNLPHASSTAIVTSGGSAPSIFGSLAQGGTSGGGSPLSFGSLATGTSSSTSTPLSFGSLVSTKEGAKSAFGASDEKTFAMKPLFPTTPHKGAESPVKDPNTSKDEVEEYEPQVEFKPVVPMPALVEVKTGEEEEDTLFCERSKLYRYDLATREWKERGIGDLKILKNPKSQKVRVLMRRDQTHKVCANHFITTDMALTQMSSSDRAWVWAGNDYADEEVKQERFAAKFKTPQMAAAFKESFQKAQDYLKSCPELKDDQNADPPKLTKETPTQSLADRFRPAPGSWECSVCLLSNKPSSTACLACQTPKEGGDKPTPTPPAKAEEPKADKGSLSELFKPAAGSWECPSCLVRNKPETSACIACSTAKPGSADGQQLGKTVTFAAPAAEKTFSAPAFKFGTASDSAAFTFGPPKADSPKPAFTFGFQAVGSAGTPAATSFSFGLPQQPAQTVTSIPATTAPPQEAKPSNAFSFSWKPPTGTSTSTPTPSASSTSTTAPTSMASPIFPPVGMKTPEKDGNKGSTTPLGTGGGKFEFNLSPTKGGGAKSPRSRDVSTCESEDGEGDHLYFEPVIALPDKIEVVTGEEDEEVLYLHRAKLYRHVGGEWKERGIGNAKILQHKATKKIRLLMRRENIHKICLNHLLTPDLTFRKKDDQSLCWVAQDFSEGDPAKETFAIRFKTPDIAGGFVQALSDARVKLGGAPLNLAFPKGPPILSPTGKEAPNGHPAPTSPSIFSASVSPGSGGSVFGGHKWSAGSTTPPISSSFTLKGSPISKTPASPTVVSPEKLFGDAASSAKEKAPPTLVKADADTTSDVEVVYESKASDEQVAKARLLMLPDNFFLYENSPPCPGCIGCQRDDDPHTNAPPQGSEDTKVKEATPTKSGAPAESFFTPASSISAKPAFELFKTPVSDASKLTFGTPSVSIFGNSPSAPFGGGSIFGNTSASSPSKAVSFLSGGDSAISFKDFAAKTEGSIFGQSKSSGSNSSVWKPKAVFNTPKSPDKDDSTADDDNYDPHYEPVVAMPDIVEVKTGEEGWQDLFCERSKVFRFDGASKEWKERGIGNFKIQHEPAVDKYRFLQRREQVHKLSCNHILSPAITVAPLMSSEVAWFWTATDFSEGQQGEYMKLAVKFKNKEIADRFKAVFDECQRKMALGPAAGGAKAKADEEERGEGDQDEEEEELDEEEEEEELDEEEEEEEDDDHPFFYDTCRLSKQKLHGQWQDLGEVDLRLHYDSDAYGVRVTAVLPSSGQVVANHLICIQTVLSTADGTRATWVALDTLDDTPTRHWFKAEFKSPEALDLFKDGFREGKECAEHGDLEEKTEESVPQGYSLYYGQGYEADDRG